MGKNDNLLTDFYQTHQWFLVKEAGHCDAENYYDRDDILQELMEVACRASRRCNGSRQSNFAYIRKSVHNRTIWLNRKAKRQQRPEVSIATSQVEFFDDIDIKVDWEREYPNHYDIICLLADGMSSAEIVAMGLGSRDKVRWTKSILQRKYG